MTNKEAVVILGNLSVNGDECYTISEYQQAKAKAIDALMQGEWIPVSERLPKTKYSKSLDDGSGTWEESDQVVILTKNGRYAVCVFSRLDSMEAFFTSEGQTIEDYKVDDVKAWMPLPKPYEEDSDES